MFGPVTGATSLRQGHERMLFHVRAGYADEAARIVRQLREPGTTAVALFAQDDAFGQALLVEVKKAADAAGLRLTAEVRVDPKQPDLEGAARAVAAAAPQARGTPPSASMFEGYMHARVLLEGLRRAGRALDSDRLVAAFESAGEIAFGKFALHYTPQSHRGSAYVELAIIGSDGRLRY